MPLKVFFLLKINEGISNQDPDPFIKTGSAYLDPDPDPKKWDGSPLLAIITAEQMFRDPFVFYSRKENNIFL